ncbi:MAG: TonB-dependent receptor, partial [Bacteroidota bacterium]
MVKARTTNVLSNLILAFFLPVFCFGQQVSGALKGIVYDANGEPLIGAYVSLQDTDWRTVTDVDGVYAFAAIPAGEYTLIATYVGASDLETVVQVTGPVTEVDLRLEEDANVLAEAVVLAKTAAREQQERALQIESVELQKVVSRVKDVGEVIERLPGVNVRGSGSFGDRIDISLNGLNGTAVRTFIDGLPLEIVFPQFTINNIPVNSIARVDVYKGVVPIDVGSDALGGGVNVITEQRNVNELRASYGFGSFNTHQAAVSGNYTLSEGVSVGANVTYNYSDNNYTMNAFVFEDNERREIERFHDAYRLTFGSIHLDVRGKKWADRFRFTANANEYYKEVQNGGIIGNLAFGGTFYDGGGTAFSTLYEKKIGQKLTLTTNGAYSRTKVIFVDTTANVFSWSGNILTRRPNSPGELGRSSLSDRDFDNIANRTTLRWALTPRDEFLLSNLVANQSTIGRDEKRPIERDPLTRNQSLLKDVLGLQYQRKLFQDKLTFGVAGKLYYYNLAGVDANALTDVSISGTDYGYYASAKYDFNDRFFVRASFENALRIPTFVQFFGNGANIAANLTLKPETSDNLNVGASYASPRGNDLRFLLTLNGFTRSQNNL